MLIIPLVVTLLFHVPDNTIWIASSRLFSSINSSNILFLPSSSVSNLPVLFDERNSAILFFAMLNTSSCISEPIIFLLSFNAAIPVVPPPRKGSNTTWPSTVRCEMIYSASVTLCDQSCSDLSGGVDSIKLAMVYDIQVYHLLQTIVKSCHLLLRPYPKALKGHRYVSQMHKTNTLGLHFLDSL